MSNSSGNATANASINAKMGLFGWLTLLFVVLKLDPGNHLSSAVEDWPWWLVLLPVWIWFAIFAVGAVAFGVVFGIVTLADHFKAKKRRKERLARLNR